MKRFGLVVALLFLAFPGWFSSPFAFGQPGQKSNDPKTNKGNPTNPGLDLPPGLPPQLAQAFENVAKNRVLGPQKITLGNLATFELKKGDGFIPAPQAIQLMNALGNRSHQGEVLGIVTKDDDLDTMLVFEAHQDGHIDDAGAEKLDAAGLLDSIRKNTEESNKERSRNGGTGLTVTGWDETPNYDRGKHILSWSITAREGPDSIINYTQIILGREARIQTVAVSDSANAKATKAFAKEILGTTQFLTGKRYEDFQPGTDRVAEYGLAALITGIAAKKLGLLAVIGVFFVKAWKLILIGVAVLGGGLFKLFGGKKAEQPPAETP